MLKFLFIFALLFYVYARAEDMDSVTPATGAVETADFDLDKQMQALEQVKKDPQGYFSKLPADQQKEIRDIAGQLQKANLPADDSQ